MNFPVYRKYKGLDVWFKITDDKNFIEVKRVGKNLMKSEVHAKQFPELLLIMDMIKMEGGRWEPCESTVVEALLLN